MDRFIIYPDDYKSAIHLEILNTIIRGDEETRKIAENQAISYMKSKLIARYDVDAIFSMRADQRDTLLVGFAVDITLYHLHCIHNPQKMPEERTERYKRACEWLKEVVKCNAHIPNAPLLEPQNEKAYILSSSRPKRTNHFN